MTLEIAELEDVVNALREGRTATPVTIRTFLSWFGAKRRTIWNVHYIDAQMAEAGLRTVPSYLELWVDAPITFELVDHPAKSAYVEPDDVIRSDPEETRHSADDFRDLAYSNDPSFRIGRIASATKAPVSVKPNATLEEAITLMLANNFSQIPVMTNEREVKGIVSWASIGARHATNTTAFDVQAFMENHHELRLSASLFSAIQVIRQHDYVLTRSTDNKIAGIVTADDIALEFENISTPFLLLAEIENNLRALISAKLSIAEIKIACGEQYLPKGFTQVSELTFGNYVRVLDNPDNWKKLNIGLDKATLCAELREVNKIRNDVMHFDPDPLQPADLLRLQNVAKMFDLLRNLGAF